MSLCRTLLSDFILDMYFVAVASFMPKFEAYINCILLIFVLKDELWNKTCLGLNREVQS